MNLPVTVREAVLEDAPAISMLLGELGYASNRSKTMSRLIALQKHETDRIFVATRNNEIVGMVGVHIMLLLHKDGNSARITALIVTDLARGQGVGRALMGAAEEFAWTHQCVQIEVTSGDARADAHRFYQHIGYSVDSRRFIKPGPGGES